MNRFRTRPARLTASILATFLVLFSSAFGQSSADSEALLPDQFSGWKIASVQNLSAPREADSTATDLLKEDGFVDGQAAVYIRAGRKLKVKAARFKDASGAYSAFTFYKQPFMQPVSVGQGSGAAGGHVLFYKGGVLVDALFEQVSVMSASELRQLAELLPEIRGAEASLPAIPRYLPKQAYVANSARYFYGPVGLARSGINFAENTIDFSRGAEVATGEYTTQSGTGMLTLVSYPTPQIAAERFKAFDAMRQTHAGSSAEDQGFQIKRTGPILAVTSGAFSSAEARELLAAINYDADVTWNQNTFLGKRDNIGNLMMALFELVGLLLAFTLIAGLAFGGARLVLNRFFPHRITGPLSEPQFISLNLTSGERTNHTK